MTPMTQKSEKLRRLTFAAPTGQFGSNETNDFKDEPTLIDK